MSQQEESYFENATVNLEINNIEYYQWNNATESDILECTDDLETLGQFQMLASRICYKPLRSTNLGNYQPLMFRKYETPLDNFDCASIFRKYKPVIQS